MPLLPGDAVRQEVGAIQPVEALDDLLLDEVMAPVLRSAGYGPNEFREMMTEMAWTLARLP